MRSRESTKKPAIGPIAQLFGSGRFGQARSRGGHAIQVLAFVGVTMGEWLIATTLSDRYAGLGVIFRDGMAHSQYQQVYITMFLMMSLVFLSGVIFETITSADTQQGLS